MKNLLKTLMCLSFLVVIISCTKDEDNDPVVDHRSIITSTDFFINNDGTVDLMLTGDFVITTEDLLSFGNQKRKGFIYSKTSNETPNSTNTLAVPGPSTAYLNNLPKGENYYIRGFFQMEDNSYFFGEEIQVTTDVEASSSRTITLEIESTPFFISQTEVTPTVNISNLTKEAPAELGFEYSVNSDFSNSTTKDIEDYDGATIPNLSGVLLHPSYSTEVISGLTASTSYYFRSYAKYADGTITNGGTNTATFTTSD